VTGDYFVAELPGELVADAQAVVKDLASQYSTVEDPGFLAQAAIWAHELPRPLREQLYEFRLTEPHGVCLVRGYPVDDAELGPTPDHWSGPSPTLSYETFFYLCASLLGEPFAWSTEQRGHVMHNVVPVRAAENAQLGGSSATALTWHTEDGFHPYRADYVGLMCLRNPDRVATTCASVRELDLPADLVEVLRQPRFVIFPDEAHLSLEHSAAAAGAGASAALVERAHAAVVRMHDDPEPVSALFGDLDRPYLRVNSYYMRAVDGDAQAAAALRGLIDALDARLSGIALAPGEICFLDNYAMVHGRSAFRARYDGTDRWLKRLNVTRDLRKSRDLRVSAGHRTIF
jgi:enduracididine beta-hydroxylase